MTRLLAIWLLLAACSAPSTADVAAPRNPNKSAEIDAGARAPEVVMVTLEQGTNRTMGAYEVGVLAIIEDPPGSGQLLMGLSVYDPKSGEDKTVKVRKGELLQLGETSYRVVEITAAAAGKKGFGKIEQQAR
jgi:hypothetical protein